MSRGYRVNGGGGGDPGPPGESGLTDGFTIGIKAADTNAAPTDAATYEVALALEDAVPGQTEAVSLTFPSGVWAETQPPPTDGNSFTVRVWLSGSAGAGTSNPGNANGQNNGTVATLQTQVAGTNPIVMTSELGANIPGGITMGSLIFRGWFSSSNQLVTSNGSVVATSVGGLFPDITIYSNSRLGGSDNYLTTPLLFNLLSAGVDTFAKAQSMRIVHRVVDLAAGVTPHSMTVDAAAVDITGAFT